MITKTNSKGYYQITRNHQTKRLSRVIMEQHLGRKLTRDEVVHHINRVKIDNRIENLMVMTAKEHNDLHRPEVVLKNTKNKKCTILNCGKKHRAQGLCIKHYGEKFGDRKNPETRKKWILKNKERIRYLDKLWHRRKRGDLWQDTIK